VHEPVDKLKHVAEEIEHPVEAAKDLAHEAEEGVSPRTPWIAISGVGLVVGTIVVLLLAVAMTVYFVYGGR
jgi:tetrahydromethanopterin S-methyltransferase subunit B